MITKKNVITRSLSFAWMVDQIKRFDLSPGANVENKIERTSGNSSRVPLIL
jgi:hypothetical protein